MPNRPRGPEPQVFEVGSSTLRLWDIAPDILVVQVVGHGEGVFAKHVNAVVDRMVAASPTIEMFFEMSRMPTYDSELRTSLTDRFLAVRKQIRAIRAITKSKIVLMGAAVANMILGGLVEIYGNEAKFAAAVDQAAARSPSGFSSAMLFATTAVREA